MTIKTIKISEYIYAQGVCGKTLPGGRIVIRVEGQELTGIEIERKR